MTVMEKPVDLDQALEAALERELREFFRRDAAARRRAPEADNGLVANDIATLFEHVAGTSVQKIDGLIAGLQTLRSLLPDQAARIQRELVQYAHLSQSAIQSMKIIAESIVQSKNAGDWPSHTAPRKWLQLRKVG